MQPSSKEMQRVEGSLGGLVPSSALHVALQGLQNGGGAAGHDEFFDQMMSGFGPAWPPGLGRSLFRAGKSPLEQAADEGMRCAPYDDSSLLVSRLRQQQDSSGDGSSPTGKSMLQQMMLLHSAGQMPEADADAGVFLPLPLPLPLSLGNCGSGESGLHVDESLDGIDTPFKFPNPSDTGAIYNNGFRASLQRVTQAPHQHLHHPQPQHQPCLNYGDVLLSATGARQTPASAVASASAVGCTAPPRPRVRARRGQATDPHSIAERLRRERIAERMKALQELVPNANKTDKASMLDEIIDYVKFLQLQVKVLSMSRLGGAAAVAPLMSSESVGAANGAAVKDDGITAAENQVAKLMDDDMGLAMQYLQGKGLCLMPISLASAISIATCHPRPPPSLGQLGRRSAHAGTAATDAPSSPSMSALTVQSTNGGCASGAKD